MQRHLIVGIDLGTHTTRVVVCERGKGDKYPHVIGTGMAPTRGVRHGYVTNIDEAGKSIKKAIHEAEQNSKINIKRAFVSIGGISLSSEIATGTAIISKANGEITTLDIQKAIAEAEEALTITNKRVLESIPVSFKLDGKELMGRPEGMRGIKLEIKVLFITCLLQHLEDLVTAVAEAGVEVLDVVPSSLAASAIALTERQKTAGCILVNIGAETVSVAVFENGRTISLHVFNIGSTDITNDIALGLRVPLDEAESIKTGGPLYTHPKKKLDEIIEARLSDIFEYIENHLKKIKRNGLLPAGVILTGGGAQLAVIEELSKSLLKLPSRVGALDSAVFAKQKVRDPSWYVALGLCFIERNIIFREPKGGFGKLVEQTKNFFKSITKQLMP